MIDIRGNHFISYLFEDLMSPCMWYFFSTLCHVSISGCPSFSKPRDGTVDPEKDWYEFGESVTLFCRRGFNLIGNERLICLRTGVWSAQIPTCSDEMFEGKE